MNTSVLMSEELISKWGNDRVESRQLAAQVGDQDDDDWLLVAPPPEELLDGNSTLSASRLLLHLLQLGRRCVSATSQPQQGCREDNGDIV